MKFILFWLTLLVALPSFAADADFLAIDSAFSSGHYDKVELLALRVLQSTDSIGNDERARVCLTAGYALIMLNREPEARSYFNRALDAVPSLTLDPVLVSPKFRMVFDEVKAARPTRPNPGPPTLSPLENKQATSARILNLLVPGAGQLQEKKYIKGGLFLALETACTVLWISEVSKTADSRSDYLAATVESDIRAKYETYNSHYKNSWTYGISAGAVYVLSQLDLAFFPPKSHHPSLSVIPAPRGLQASLRW